jgi:hypothetical protein
MATPDPGLPRNIGVPATRALTAAGYTELSQLANVPAAELAKLHGVGPKAVRLLQEALQAQGKSLRSARDFAREEWPLRGSAADVLT